MGVLILGEGNGNPLQYSCLENPMDWGAWWATVRGVTKSRTRLSDFCVCVCVCVCLDSWEDWQFFLRSTLFVISRYNTVLLTTVTMLCIISPWLICLTTSSYHQKKKTKQFPGPIFCFLWTLFFFWFVLVFSCIKFQYLMSIGCLFFNRNVVLKSVFEVLCSLTGIIKVADKPE